MSSGTINGAASLNKDKCLLPCTFVPFLGRLCLSLSFTLFEFLLLGHVLDQQKNSRSVVWISLFDTLPSHKTKRSLFLERNMLKPFKWLASNSLRWDKDLMNPFFTSVSLDFVRYTLYLLPPR